MRIKERRSLVYWAAGLLVALMLMPWAAQLTHADTNVQLVEFKYQFGEGDRSHVKLDLLGYDTLQVDEGKQHSNMLIWVGVVAVSVAIAVSLSESDTPTPELRCFFIIDGSGSKQVCR